MRWLWLDTTYACGGVAINAENRVTHACPIYRRFSGRQIGAVIDHLKRKKVFRACKALP